MAFKDKNSEVCAGETAPTQDQLRQLEIERIFLEIGQEFGMTEVDLMFPGEAEKGTVVYDKFSVHRR